MITYHNPALLAKVTTTLDVISRGRAILGIGAAWFEGEHARYGTTSRRWASASDARGGAEDLAGRCSPRSRRPTGQALSVDGALNNPRPIRGDIPIMIGGSGEKKTLRLVAQYADASNVFGDPEQPRHLVGVLDGHCERLGRDRAEITTTGLSTLVIGHNAWSTRRRS